MRKYLNIMIATSFASASAFFTSCNKDISSQNPQPEKSAMQLMTELLIDTIPNDFDVYISSSKAVNIGPGNPLPMTAVIGYNKYFSNYGTLKVNHRTIPYVESNKAYIKEADTALPYTVLTGNTLNINYTSSSSLTPSFSYDLYSPSIAHLSFTGLTNGKINRLAGFTVSWSVDPLYSSQQAYVALQGEKDNSKNKSTVILKQVNDSTGSVTFTPSELATLSSYQYATLYYGKGYHEKKIVSGKKIGISFIAHSYSSIDFE
jgi:hypothetical protein